MDPGRQNITTISGERGGRRTHFHHLSMLSSEMEEWYGMVLFQADWLYGTRYEFSYI